MLCSDVGWAWFKNFLCGEIFLFFRVVVVSPGVCPSCSSVCRAVESKLFCIFCMALCVGKNANVLAFSVGLLRVFVFVIQSVVL